MQTRTLIAIGLLVPLAAIISGCAQVYGDFIAQDARWPQIRRNGIDFTDGIAKAGGKVEVVDLPSVGIRGNSHMLMMDRNNLEVAALIQRWLERQGLYR